MVEQELTAEQLLEELATQSRERVEQGHAQSQLPEGVTVAHKNTAFQQLAEELGVSLGVNEPTPAPEYIINYTPELNA